MIRASPNSIDNTKISLAFSFTNTITVYSVGLLRFWEKKKRIQFVTIVLSVMLRLKHVVFSCESFVCNVLSYITLKNLQYQMVTHSLENCCSTRHGQMTWRITRLKHFKANQESFLYLYVFLILDVVNAVMNISHCTNEFSSSILCFEKFSYIFPHYEYC